MDQYKDPQETSARVVEDNNQQDLKELRFLVSKLFKKLEEVETRLARMEDGSKTHATAIRTLSKRTR